MSARESNAACYRQQEAPEFWGERWDGLQLTCPELRPW